MSAQARYFKIGVFVLGGVALAVSAVVILGVGALFEKKIIMETYFDESVQGLGVGAPVKYRGVTVGNVESISFAGNEYKADLQGEEMHRYGHYIVVRLSVKEVFPGMSDEEHKKEIQHNIDEGLRVRLASQGITGVFYLEADFYDPKEDIPLAISWTPKYPRVPSTRSTVAVLGTALSKIAKDLEKTQVHKVAQDLDTLILAVTRFVQDTDMEKFGAHAGQALADLHGTAQEVRRLVESPEVKAILSDAAAVAKGAKQVVGELSQTVRDIKTVSQKLPDGIAQLQKSLRRVDSLLTSKGQDLEDIIENARVVSENLRELTNNAKRYPAQVLLGEPPPRIGPAKR
jgi:phospholipid/cholesterol/gamma-HCH transport system substrate-binding protein/paraquat-inducible protein B